MREIRDFNREKRVNYIEELLAKTSFDNIEEDLSVDELIPVDEVFKGSVKVTTDILDIYGYLEIKDSVGCVCELTFDDVKRVIESRSEFFSKRTNWNLVRSIFDDVIISHKEIQATIIARGDLVEAHIPEHILVNDDLNRSAKPKVCRDGHVDFHHIHAFTFVKKDQHLGKIIRVKEGIDGRTLDGRVIPYPTMVINNYSLGENIKQLKDNFFSEIDGTLSFNKGVYEVRPLLTIEGNLDYSTGDLDFDGDILILGSVREGFNIKSLGGLTVQGSIEPSNIVCENSIVVKDGILGSSDSNINCGGPLKAKFINNGNVNCNNSVYVTKDIYKSKINSKSDIYISKGGAIIGGHISTQNNIIAYNVGNNMSVKTLVTLGIDYEAKDKLIETKGLIDKIIVEMAVLQEDLIVTESRAEREKIKSLFLSLKSRVNSLHQYSDKLLGKIDVNDRAVLTVNGIIYPGVEVEICNVRLVIEKELKNVKLFLSKESGKINIEYL